MLILSWLHLRTLLQFKWWRSLGIQRAEAEEDSEKDRVKVYTMGDSCWTDKGSTFPALSISGRTTNENDGLSSDARLNMRLCTVHA
ncbi:hypothetical protein PIB30_033088 [Stylosanthes scabra]|uniref:Uncharacterized protein n=1 Tax=Stylosanthes scabra TaxID=79078 RepID=A0ABU6RCI6_9FABA|nr:hypothetical protein [Stylosanthes scabra]